MSRLSPWRTWKLLELVCLVQSALLSATVVGFVPSTRWTTSRAQWHASDVTTRHNMSGTRSKRRRRGSRSDTPHAPTLYQILQAPSDASRTDLKRQYIKLAKTLHPDAAFGSDNAQDDKDGRNPDVSFSDVASAWKTLSDPLLRKRYDRSLQAEVIVHDVEQAAVRIGETTAPYVRQIYEELAKPLFRRTTATTSAVFHAATHQGTVTNATTNVTASVHDNNNNNDTVSTTKSRLDLQRTVRSVFQAGIDAGRSIDRLELSEKSYQLFKKAQSELSKHNQMVQKLESTKQARMRLALRLPNYAPLSSDEAIHLLETFHKKNNHDTNVNNITTTTTSHGDHRNGTDTSMSAAAAPKSFSLVTLFFSSKEKRGEGRLYNDIARLRAAETRYGATLSSDHDVQSEYRKMAAASERSRTDAAHAVEEVERLQRALVEAQRRVVETRQESVQRSKHLAALETVRNKSSTELDRVSVVLRRKREKVRGGLVKEEAKYEARGDNRRNSTSGLGGDVHADGASSVDVEAATGIPKVGASMDSADAPSFTAVTSSELTTIVTDEEEFRALVREEKFLRLESARLIDRASRLESRAKELKERSGILKDMEHNS